MSKKTNKDLLNRDKFVALLKDIVAQQSLNEEYGFSFAIDGKWGCGKTFILNMLEEQLRSEGYLVLHYNCWENDFYDEPLMAIISVIINELEHLVKGKMAPGAKTRAKSCLKFFKSVAATVFEYKTGLNAAALLEAGKDIFKDEKSKALPRGFDTMLPLKDAIEGVREKITQIKKDFNGIVIIVDEVDRCLPEYSIKVLERLHHVCFGIPVVQLIALNKDELAASISRAFGKNFSNEKALDWTVRKNGNDVQHIEGNVNDKGKSNVQLQFADYYLLKFIQLVIPVPQSSLNDKLLDVLDGLETEFNHSGCVNIEYVAAFIRDVLNTMPMRDIETIVRQAKTMHLVAKARLGEIERPSLGILCYELVESLFRFKNVSGKQKIYTESNGRYGYNYFIYIPKDDAIGKCLKEWSLSECDYYESVVRKNRTAKNCEVYQVHNPKRQEDYVKLLFLNNEIEENGYRTRKFEFQTMRDFSDNLYANTLRDVIDIL